jgi:hypothetical protein
MDWKVWVATVLTLMFTALQYVDPDRLVLKALHLPGVPTWASVDVFRLLSSLGFLVLLVMGFRRLAATEKEAARVKEATKAGLEAADRHLGRVDERLKEMGDLAEGDGPAPFKLLEEHLGHFDQSIRQLAEVETKVRRMEKRLDPGGPAIAELDQLLTRGEELLGKARTIPQDAVLGPVEARHVLDDVFVWEREIGAWLDQVKPAFKADLVANFYVPPGADMRETAVLRVVVRLERLRSVKASLS